MRALRAGGRNKRGETTTRVRSGANPVSRGSSQDGQNQEQEPFDEDLDL